MKPPDWPQLSSAVFYDDAARAIDWLCKAFGFEVRIKIQGEDGKIHHSELTHGEAVVMVSNAGKRDDHPGWPAGLSPRTANGNTQSLMLYVDNVDAHCAQARANGAQIADEPADHDYGRDHWADRSYGVIDCEGHMWWFSQRIRNPPSA